MVDGAVRRGLGVAAVAAAPGHGPVDHQRLVGLDDRRERGCPPPVDVDDLALAGPDVDHLGPRLPVVALVAQHHGGADGPGIGQGDARLEEGVGGAFGEIPRLRAGGMAAALELGKRGETVGVRIASRVARDADPARRTSPTSSAGRRRRDRDRGRRRRRRRRCRRASAAAASTARRSGRWRRFRRWRRSGGARRVRPPRRPREVRSAR